MTKVESGVMVVKDGKAWGVSYRDGQSLSYGWVTLEDGLLGKTGYCKQPTDLTYKGSPDFSELSTGKLVAVKRHTSVIFKES